MITSSSHMSATKKKSPDSALAQLHSLLHHLGWNVAAFTEMEALGNVGKWQTAPLPDGNAMLIVLVKDELRGTEEAFKAYEDLTQQQRQIAARIHEAELRLRHVLLIDDRMHTQLIDFAQEEVLLEARGAEATRDRLAPLLNLNALARGSLATHSMKSPGQRARELADWTRVWSPRIGAAAQMSRETMRTLHHWLFLARLAEQLGYGPKRRKRFSEYALDAKPAQAGRYLSQVFKPLAEQWNLLQGVSTAKIRDIIQGAFDSGQLAPCLESFSRLSASKFSASVFAEAFADDELRLLGWRNSLLEAPCETRGNAMEWLSQPLVIDLDATGFPLLLKKFDAVTDDLRRFAREQAVQAARGERAGLQLDAFAAPLSSFTEEETPRLVLQVVLQVVTAKRERAELARLVLLAHAAEWHARLREPEPIFPVPQITVAEAPTERRIRPNPQDAWMN
ncbi:hypothetical protein IT570_11325 [Candidatus Sumerlaeota bacterium]|nr:hypothetical protein [Candidatus Sumerlaeota bacterium]